MLRMRSKRSLSLAIAAAGENLSLPSSCVISYWVDRFTRSMRILRPHDSLVSNTRKSVDASDRGPCVWRVLDSRVHGGSGRE